MVSLAREREREIVWKSKKEKKRKKERKSKALGCAITTGSGAYKEPLSKKLNSSPYSVCAAAAIDEATSVYSYLLRGLLAYGRTLIKLFLTHKKSG
jgi:hypothetical protein